MLRIVAVLGAVCWLHAAGCATAGEQTQRLTADQTLGEERELPSYTATRTSASITIDGRLDEAEWEKAEERSMVDIYTGGPLPLKSTFRMLWDDSHLYLGVYFEDEDAWATYTGEDDRLWEEEVLEFFIDADGDGNTYYEHEINPVNAKVDLLLHRSRETVDSWRDWDFKTIRSAVFVEGDGKNAGTEDEYWSIEVAIPFADLYEMPHVPPVDGDMWRMNLYRIERDNPIDKREVSVGAFSPCYSGNAHATWMFGKVYFGAGQFPEPDREVGSGGTPGADRELPSYTVTRTAASMAIDGRLDEDEWGRAEERVMADAYTGGATPQKSTFRMLWDDSYLYLGVYFEDRDAWATYTEEDDPLWEEEVLEFFIDPDGDGNTYYEHEINPVNAWVDLFLHRSRETVDVWREWDFKNIRSAVYVEGDGKNAGTEDEYWTVEVAIPFADLYEAPHIPPLDGDMWRMNVYRIERDNPADKTEVFLAAFSPPYSGHFHATWMFGEIYFRK